MTREELTREAVIKYLQTYSKCKDCTNVCYDMHLDNECEIYTFRESVNFDDIIEYLIEALSEPKTEPTKIDNMTNGDVIKAMFPDMDIKPISGSYVDYFRDCRFDYMWFNKPYKGNFTMPTRPKAKWIRHGACNYTCSECGFPVNQKYDFCVCGAEMESE